MSSTHEAGTAAPITTQHRIHCLAARAERRYQLLRILTPLLGAASVDVSLHIARHLVDKAPCQLLLFSGFAHGRVHDYIDRLAPPTDEARACRWSREGTMNARIEAAAVDLGLGRLVVCGGLDDHPKRGRWLHTAEVYCSLQSKWFRLPALHCARVGCAGALVGSYLYVAGGKLYNDGNHVERLAVSCVEGALQSRAEWHKLEPITLAQAKVLCGSQWTSMTREHRQYVLQGGAIESFGQASKADTEKWEVVKAEPQHKRYFPAAGNVNGLLVVAGGDEQALGSVEGFDGCQWCSLVSMPSPRRVAGFCTWSGKLVVAGGEDSDGVIRTVVSFDGQNWNSMPEMRYCRLGPALSVVNSELWVVGGVDETNEFVATIERLAVGSLEWVVAGTECDLLAPRHACYAACMPYT